LLRLDICVALLSGAAMITQTLWVRGTLRLRKISLTPTSRLRLGRLSAFFRAAAAQNARTAGLPDPPPGRIAL